MQVKLHYYYMLTGHAPEGGAPVLPGDGEVPGLRDAEGAGEHLFHVERYQQVQHRVHYQHDDDVSHDQGVISCRWSPDLGPEETCIFNYTLKPLLKLFKFVFTVS